MGHVADLPLEILIEILSLLGPVSLKPRAEELATRYRALLLTATVNEGFYIASRALLWSYLVFRDRESAELWLKEVHRIEWNKGYEFRESERRTLENGVDRMGLSSRIGDTEDGTTVEATEIRPALETSPRQGRFGAERACLGSGEIPATKYLSLTGAGPLQDQVLGQAAKNIMYRVNGSVTTLILKNIFGLDSMIFNSPALQNVNYLDLNTRFTFDDELRRTMSRTTTTPSLFPSLSTLIVSQPIPTHLFRALLTPPSHSRNPNLVDNSAPPASRLEELELNLMTFTTGDQIRDVGGCLALAASSVRVLRIVSVMPLDKGFLEALGSFHQVKILSVSVTGIPLSRFLSSFPERMRLLAFMVVRMDQLDAAPAVGDEDEEDTDAEIIKELKRCLHDPRFADVRTWLIADGVPPLDNTNRPPPAPASVAVAQRRLEEAQLDRLHPHHAAQGGDEDRYYDEEEEEEEEWWKLKHAKGLDSFLALCRERQIQLHLD